MNASPLVSVIIPCFNTPAKDLKRSIESVLAQDYGNLELIVVDDGSTEPFSGLDREKQLLEHGIRWDAQAENRGVSATRNAGISLAKGLYIAFLDAGDWWEPKKISAQMSVMEDDQIGLVYCGAEFHPVNGGPSWVEMRDVTESAYRELLIRQPISGSASAAMVRRQILIDLGGFETNLEIPEDRDMWLRIAKFHKVALVREVLTHIEVNPISRSSDPMKKAESYRRFLKIYDSDIREQQLKGAAYSHFHVVIARKFLMQKRYYNALKHLFRAILASPVFVARGIVKGLGKSL